MENMKCYLVDQIKQFVRIYNFFQNEMILMMGYYLRQHKEKETNKEDTSLTTK